MVIGRILALAGSHITQVDIFPTMAPGRLEDLSPVQINQKTKTGDPDAKMCKHSSDVMSDVMIHTCRIGTRDDMGLSPSVRG